jgi:uncharacterized protein YggU (UPF0235/DUF167 family)
VYVPVVFYVPNRPVTPVQRSAIMSVDDECVGVAVDAPAREGEANKALVEFLAAVRALFHFVKL